MEAIIFYDSHCVMCNWVVRFVLRYDRKEQFLFAPLNGETAHQRLPKGFEKVDSVYLYEREEGGSPLHFTSSGAVFRICQKLGGGWKLLGGLRHLPPQPFDGLYRLVARSRYQVFGKLEHCPLPPQEVRHRFLP